MSQPHLIEGILPIFLFGTLFGTYGLMDLGEKKKRRLEGGRGVGGGGRVGGGALDVASLDICQLEVWISHTQAAN